MTIIAGSGLLSISIALNSISMHGTCTAVFVAVATIATFLLASIQTLEKIAWVTYAGFISLVVSRESRPIVLLSSPGEILNGVLSPPQSWSSLSEWVLQTDLLKHPKRDPGTNSCTFSTTPLLAKRWVRSGNKFCRWEPHPHCEYLRYPVFRDIHELTRATFFSFSIKSEMRDPKMYNRSLLLCQAASMSFYVVSWVATH
jgi:hypothetical protein